MPVVYALHVLEEAPGFASWARRHAAWDYTYAEFARVNTPGVACVPFASTTLGTRSGGGWPRPVSRSAIQEFLGDGDVTTTRCEKTLLITKCIFRGGRGFAGPNPVSPSRTSPCKTSRFCEATAL